jgi:hypothetical protein
MYHLRLVFVASVFDDIGRKATLYLILILGCIRIYLTLNYFKTESMLDFCSKQFWSFQEKAHFLADSLTKPKRVFTGCSISWVFLAF